MKYECRFMNGCFPIHTHLHTYELVQLCVPLFGSTTFGTLYSFYLFDFVTSSHTKTLLLLFHFILFDLIFRCCRYRYYLCCCYCIYYFCWRTRSVWFYGNIFHAPIYVICRLFLFVCRLVAHAILCECELKPNVRREREDWGQGDIWRGIK